MRLKEFQQHLQKEKVDAALIVSLDMEPDPNFYYFTHFHGIGALIIPKQGAPSLLVPKMEVERAKRSAIKNVLPLDKKRLFESVALHLKRVRVLGIDYSGMTLALLKTLRRSIGKKPLNDVGKKMRELRVLKTDGEIEMLKKACREADVIVQKCMREFNEFDTESEVAAFLQYETLRKGHDISFKPIVASGKHGSMPHYVPAQERLGKGLCVIDFGVKYKGYCSDITRTIGIGKTPKEQSMMYDRLLGIQTGAIQMVKDGFPCAKVYDFVASSLGKHSPYFTHGLGHGVGVEIHELPNLTAKSEDRFADRMVFTIEPGVYFPRKFGIRIEDTILFRKKPVVLTQTTKELVEV